MTMQYGEPFPQGKSISSSEGVNFLWINFNIMNTLHEFASKPAPVLEKICSIFQIPISKLRVKANKIYIE